MSLIELLASTANMVLEGRLHMRPFQFHLKEHWRYPQLLDSLVPWSETFLAHLEWWQNPVNMMKDTDLHTKTTIPNLYRHNDGCGAHLEQVSTKGLFTRQGKKATHKYFGAEDGISGPVKVQEPVSSPTVLLQKPQQQ